MTNKEQLFILLIAILLIWFLEQSETFRQLTTTNDYNSIQYQNYRMEDKEYCPVCGQEIKDE